MRTLSNLSELGVPSPLLNFVSTFTQTLRGTEKPGFAEGLEHCVCLHLCKGLQWECPMFWAACQMARRKAPLCLSIPTTEPGMSLELVFLVIGAQVILPAVGLKLSDMRLALPHPDAGFRGKD